MEEISRTKEVDEMKTLTKEFAGVNFTFDGTNYGFDTTQGNWRQIGAGTGNFICDTYFDLAGMAMNDETLFFEVAAVQEVLNPQFAPSTAGDFMFVVDIMSQIPLTDAEVALYATQGNVAGGDVSLTFDQTIYGRVRFFNIDLDNVAGTIAILLSDNQTGSLSPTASDRVYCYRYAGVNQTAPGFSTLFAARHILRATAKEEPEYQYLMRLKRSYELQNEPDRD